MAGSPVLYNIIIFIARKAGKSLCMRIDNIFMITHAPNNYAVTCNLPTQLLINDLQVATVVNGSQDIPHREGQFITYTCSPGFILTGPSTSVCTGNGEWEPEPGEVACIGAHDGRQIKIFRVPYNAM
jgi:hypothetical protein